MEFSSSWAQEIDAYGRKKGVWKWRYRTYSCYVESRNWEMNAFAQENSRTKKQVSLLQNTMTRTASKSLVIVPNYFGKHALSIMTSITIRRKNQQPCLGKLLCTDRALLPWCILQYQWQIKSGKWSKSFYVFFSF